MGFGDRLFCFLFGHYPIYSMRDPKSAGMTIGDPADPGSGYVIVPCLHCGVLLGHPVPYTRVS